MKTLNAFFQSAQRRQRAVNDQQLQRLVKESELANRVGNRPLPSSASRSFPKWIIPSLASLAAVATVAVVSQHYGSSLLTITEQSAPLRSNDYYQGTVMTGEVWVYDGMTPLEAAQRNTGLFRQAVSADGIRPIELTVEEQRQMGINALPEGTVEVYRLRELMNGTVHPTFDEYQMDADGTTSSEQTVAWHQHTNSGYAAGKSVNSFRGNVSISLPSFRPRLITDEFGNRRMYWYTYNELDTALTRRTADLQVILDHPENQSNYTVEQIKRMKKERDSLCYRLHVKGENQFGVPNRLIPILVRTGRTFTAADSLANLYRPDLILWYDATPQFIMALPDRYRTIIQQQWNQYQQAMTAVPQPLPTSTELSPTKQLQSYPKEKQVEPNVTVLPQQSTTVAPREQEEAIEPLAVTGEAIYFESLRPSSGAIDRQMLFPNPASDHVMVRYRLAEPRTITISLHTIGGVQLQNFLEPTEQAAGEQMMEFGVNKLPAGIYLLVITTNQNEQVVQRLMVGGA